MVASIIYNIGIAGGLILGQFYGPIIGLISFVAVVVIYKGYLIMKMDI